MSLKQKIEEKAKTFEEIDVELTSVLPKHPLYVPFDSPKWKPYEKKKVEKWIQVDVVCGLLDKATEQISEIFGARYTENPHTKQWLERMKDEVLAVLGVVEAEKQK